MDAWPICGRHAVLVLHIRTLRTCVGRRIFRDAKFVVGIVVKAMKTSAWNFGVEKKKLMEYVQ